MSLVRLTEPYNMGELAILQSLLKGCGIDYIVRDANVGSLYPGVPELNAYVMVEERDLPQVEQLLNRLRLDVREV